MWVQKGTGKKKASRNTNKPATSVEAKAGASTSSDTASKTPA